MNASVARILAPGEKDLAVLGAGFLVEGGFVLTCAHVVGRADAEVELDFPLVAPEERVRAKVRSFYPAGSLPGRGLEDIALLEPFADCAIPPEARPASFGFAKDDWDERRVKMFGFPKGREDGDWTRGTVAGAVAGGWRQIDHDPCGSEIAEGFSGAAAWVEEDGETQAAGMIVAVHVRNGVKSAYMIPARTLATVLRPLHDLQKSKGRAAGDLIPKKCDRDDQDSDFSSFYYKWSVKDPFVPQFYILHGWKKEAPYSLIERFCFTYVKKLENKKWRVNANPDIRYVKAWPERRDLKWRQAFLKRQLFCCFAGEENARPECTLDDVCSTPDFKRRNKIVVVHNIDASCWDGKTRKLILWYKNEFWPLFMKRKQFKQVLVFFNVMYKDRDGKPGFFGRQASPVAKIERQLSQIESDRGGRCPCKLIERLRGVEEKHVLNWLLTHEIDRSHLKKLQELFENQAEVCMEIVESKLLEIYKEHIRLA